MNQKRVLLFTMGGWSHSNEAIIQQLESKLPRARIRVVDLLEQLKRDKRAWLAYLLDLPVMAWQALLDRGFDKSNLLYAPATSRFINHLARRITREFQPDFTVQTTTRFDASSDDVPHFTIIDVTLASVRQRYIDLYQSTERALDHLHAFQHRVFQRSTAIFAMGQYVRHSLIWDYRMPPRRVFAIGSGPNIEMGERAKLVGSKKVLFVGTDWKRKGGPVLLDAFRMIRQYHPDAELFIVGCTPDIQEHNVHVIGRVAREDLHLYFTGARVFALPTELEAFGIAFVEAMHFGLPILGTAIGAVPELVEIGVNGYLVKPGNAEALARALDRLLDDDKLALQMGEASYQRAKRYTWDRAGDILCGKMIELARENPRIPDVRAPKFKLEQLGV
ncbi:uncharacterized protein NMK_2573 [Novimethylophilus kurashikiensis]|uniref:Glycosyl transferase family 1 domain-containing protein n=1 Tax=Novimethylophilus kurashikiensis TaxID=1825523 RepID=A0A2R5F9Q9_9PROT|nr:glycosyltransferase family 4 protein [Novimethylophilus kurashikiensis]GBG14972.1 uncharacterized protein NMK_2573 [Novimethylophilus kurashikiensis]